MIIEWLKIRRTKSNLTFLLLFLIILLIPLFLARADKEEADLYKKSYWEAQLPFKEEAANQMKDIPEAEYVYDATLKEIKFIKQIVHSYEQNSYNDRISAELNYARLTLEQIERGSLVGLSSEDQEFNVAQLEFFNTHSIERIDDHQTVVPAVSYLTQLFQGIPTIIFFILFSLFFAYCYTYEQRKKTIDFLNVTPVSLKKISFNKIAATFLYISMAFLSSIAISFIVASMKSGIGDWRYPIFYRSLQSGNVEVMTSGVFLIKAVVLILMVAFFLSLISYLVSLISKYFLVNVFILGLLMVFTNLSLIGNAISGTVAQWLPTSYMDVSQLLLNQNPWNNPNIAWNNGMLYIIGLDILLVLFISILLKKNKKI